MATAALLSGCGGFDPEGRPVGATLEVVRSPIPIGIDPDTAWPQPLAVRVGDADWGKILPLFPASLPRPLDQGSECLSGFKVTVRVSSGEYVDYGPCRRPLEIEPLRRTLERMLRRRDAAEARRGRYPVEVRLHVLSGPPKFRTLETVFVKSGEQGWAQVVAAIPSPLPRPYEAYGYDYDFGCRSGYYEVTVFLLNGDQVDYGPCLRPPEVEPLRRALLRLLQQKR